MVSDKVVIKNPTGLHLRPAGLFCKTAMQYKSNRKKIRKCERQNLDIKRQWIMLHLLKESKYPIAIDCKVSVYKYNELRFKSNKLPCTIAPKIQSKTTLFNTR